MVIQETRRTSAGPFCRDVWRRRRSAWSRDEPLQFVEPVADHNDVDGRGVSKARSFLDHEEALAIRRRGIAVAKTIWSSSPRSRAAGTVQRADRGAGPPVIATFFSVTGAGSM